MYLFVFLSCSIVFTYLLAIINYLDAREKCIKILMEKKYTNYIKFSTEKKNWIISFWDLQKK